MAHSAFSFYPPAFQPQAVAGGILPPAILPSRQVGDVLELDKNILESLFQTEPRASIPPSPPHASAPLRVSSSVTSLTSEKSRKSGENLWEMFKSDS